MSPNLLTWYRANARDLPWRRRTDAYAVLVSEFMCQQTTVAAVVPFFERWMAAFPTVAALAAADEAAVLGHWQGLGYYSRARNLQAAAQAVVERHDGEIPASLEELRALPGVGEYTAGAVMAFAFDRPAAVVDANVARVLARLHDLREPIDTTRGKAFLRAAALVLQPAEGGARELNSAVMELGALVCRPRAPRCGACPIRGACRAPDPEALPVKRARAVVTEVTERRAFFTDGARLFLAQSTERWRGLWILPLTDSAGPPAHVEVYPITRYRVRMEVLRLPLPWGRDGAPPPSVAGEARASELPWDRHLRAFPLDALADVPIPSPHRRAIAAMASKMGRHGVPSLPAR